MGFVSADYFRVRKSVSGWRAVVGSELGMAGPLLSGILSLSVVPAARLSVLPLHSSQPSSDPSAACLAVVLCCGFAASVEGSQHRSSVVRGVLPAASGASHKLRLRPYSGNVCSLLWPLFRPERSTRCFAPAVPNVLAHQAFQMLFVEHDYVVEQVTSTEAGNP